MSMVVTVGIVNLLGRAWTISAIVRCADVGRTQRQSGGGDVNDDASEGSCDSADSDYSDSDGGEGDDR